MSLLVEGRRRAAENDHHDRAWLAWTIAALQRAKRMPTLEEVSGKKKRAAKPRAMSADQMLTMARMWSSAAPPSEDRQA